MAKTNIQNRIKFSEKLQKKFLEEIEEKFPIKQIACWCQKSERTIRDWKREKFLIDEKSLLTICKKSKTEYPKNIKKLDAYWYAKKGSKKGWLAVVEKYGSFPKDEKERKRGWYRWWNKKGRFQEGRIGKRKTIRKPKKSMKLAEFVGIMIGGGSITNSQIQISISSIVDKDYAYHIKKIIEDLFKTSPSIINLKNANALKIIVSRKDLVDYCQAIGLKKGHKVKNDVNIPKWIFNKIGYQKACLKGIMDTDGCIFNENHKYKNKIYKYKRWNITSASSILRKDIIMVLKNLNFSPKERGDRCVQLEKSIEIKRYFNKIGSNNPKHIKKYYQ